MPDQPASECHTLAAQSDGLGGAVNAPDGSGNDAPQRRFRRILELTGACEGLRPAISEQPKPDPRRAVDGTPGVAYTYTAAPPLRLTSVTGNTERVLGASAAELLACGEAWRHRVHPDDLDRVIANARRVLTEGSITSEYRYRNTDGTYHWIYNSATLMRERDGSPVEVAGYSLDITESRLADRVRENRERLQAVNEAFMAAQEVERKRMSRDLHDGINQRLAVLIMDISEIERDPGCPGRLAGRLAALRVAAGDITDEIRRLAGQLHPYRLEQTGLEQALRRDCAGLSERAGVKVRFECTGLPDKFQPSVALCAYRVAQEALQNMVRHAHARTGTLRIEAGDGWLHLTVTDTGDGFDPAVPSSGFGIFSMRERVRLLGGVFSLESAPGRGTRIEAWLPLSEENKV